MNSGAHEAAEGLGPGRGAEEQGLGAEGVAWSVQFAVLAHILEIVFFKQFSILRKLCWAILAIIKAHRFLSCRFVS